MLRQLPGRKPLAEAALDHRGDQVVLVLEVPVDGARRQPARLADQADAGALVTALCGDHRRRIENPVARQLAVGALPADHLLFLLCHLGSKIRILTL
jgi:hypothetical protein